MSEACMKDSLPNQDRFMQYLEGGSFVEDTMNPLSSFD